jgi:hypothetical protein
MQILENSSTKLAIHSRPLELWLFAACFPILGLLFVAELILQSQPLSDKVFSLLLIVVWSGFATYASSDLVKIIQCTIDKKLGIVIVREQGLFGTKIALRSLSEVKDVLVDKENSDRVSVKPVSLLFSSGEKLPVYMQLDLDNWHKEAQVNADMIRSFLNLNR